MADSTTSTIPEELHAKQQYSNGDDLQETVAAIEDDHGGAVNCTGCGKLADAPHRTVMVYPRPWAHEEVLQCQDCWGKEAANNTHLGEREGRILALRLAGLSEIEIRDVVGSAGGSVEKILSNLRGKLDELREERDKRKRTESVLSDAFGR